jgi:CheY-like chemotaxis protein/HPt (histidine-containing phosphotransfer) domain-containing protein
VTTTKPPGRVLLAEDDHEIRELVARLLEAAGAAVTCAEDGAVAVRAATEAHSRGAAFDLVLMDMQMPAMDGYEAVQRLRSSGYRGRIVAITGHGLPTDRARCLAIGCDEHASKPLGEEELMQLLHDASGGTANRLSSRPGRPADVPEPLVSELADDPDLADLLTEFVDGLTARVTALERACGVDDRTALNQLAHQLRGAAGGYGFPRLSELAGELERSSDSAERQELGELVQQVGEVCRRAQAATIRPTDPRVTRCAPEPAPAMPGQTSPVAV